MQVAIATIIAYYQRHRLLLISPASVPDRNIQIILPLQYYILKEKQLFGHYAPKIHKGNGFLTNEIEAASTTASTSPLNHFQMDSIEMLASPSWPPRSEGYNT
jgi:hypothetical protein